MAGRGPCRWRSPPLNGQRCDQRKVSKGGNRHPLPPYLLTSGGGAGGAVMGAAMINIETDGHMATVRFRYDPAAIEIIRTGPRSPLGRRREVLVDPHQPRPARRQGLLRQRLPGVRRRASVATASRQLEQQRLVSARRVAVGRCSAPCPNTCASPPTRRCRRCCTPTPAATAALMQRAQRHLEGHQAVSTDETDHLFTPEPFVDLKARNLRKRKPAPPKPEPPPNLIVSDGSWVAMARQGQVPHPYAHLLRPGSVYGVATTACGIGGVRALSIPADSTVERAVRSAAACPSTGRHLEGQVEEGVTMAARPVLSVQYGTNADLDRRGRAALLEPRRPGRRRHLRPRARSGRSTGPSRLVAHDLYTVDGVDFRPTAGGRRQRRRRGLRPALHLDRDSVEEHRARPVQPLRAGRGEGLEGAVRDERRRAERVRPYPSTRAPTCW